MFTTEDLTNIIDIFRQKIFAAYANGELEEFLHQCGVEYITKSSNEKNNFSGTPEGKILIIGESSVKQNNIIGMLKDPEFGFTNTSIMKRFEFIFEYETLNSYPFRKLTKWNYAVILAGPMPHSVKGRGDNSSLLTMLERNDDDIFPPVIRLTANEQLKITKQNVHDTILDLMKKGVIAA